MKAFQDNKGNTSIMRIAFAWLMFNAAAMAWYVITRSEIDIAGAVAIFGTVASVATGLKLMQKQQEK